MVSDGKDITMMMMIKMMMMMIMLMMMTMIMMMMMTWYSCGDVLFQHPSIIPPLPSSSIASERYEDEDRGYDDHDDTVEHNYGLWHS